jgi:presenilin 1
MHGAAPMWVCAVAVLAGLCGTLALLPIIKQVLPALPISIAVGIAFYFCSAKALSPMAHACAAVGVLL